MPIKEIVQQIQSRKKAKSKLQHWHKIPGVIFPTSDYLEQSSSEKTAELKASSIKGKSLVDLTGGTGADSYFFSRKFERVVYVEPNEELFNLAKHNFHQLEVDNVKFSNSTAEDYLEKAGQTHDWFYIDPSRRKDGQRVYQLRDCQPDVLQILPKILATGAKVLLKLSPLLDIHLAQNQLESVSKVTVVSVNNDCKELLFQLEAQPGRIAFEAVNITNDEVLRFDFRAGEEDEASANHSVPINYLYEPNASVLKLGAFKLIAKKFDLFKLHPNTHLYTSKDLVTEFPGRIFKIKSFEAFNWKSLKRGKIKMANITTRNFQHSVETIRKRTGINDGGEGYLFFARTAEENLLTISCQKV